MKNVPIDLLLAGAGVGHRHMTCRFDSFQAESQSMAEVLGIAKGYARDWPQPTKGRSLVFTGPPGTGKTHLCTAIAAELLGRRISVMHTTMGKAIRRVRDTWSKASAKSESQAMGEMLSPALLVIDEFLPATDFERELIAELLNERYAQRKPFIIATNAPASELASHLPARTIDRMREDGGLIVPFLWESHRGKLANTREIT